MSFPSDQNRPVVCIMGPTGVGKTDLALALAEQTACKLISIDSVMVFRGMDIGSAKPDYDILVKYPHQLINILNPWETYSVAQCIQDVTKCIDDAHRHKQIPVLVGGTMMYHYALQFGMSLLPSAKPLIRNGLAREEITNGLSSQWQELYDIDAKYASHIKREDRQRIHRGLELYRASGTKPSILLKRTMGRGILKAFNVQNIVIAVEDRQALYRQLGQRFDLMLQKGLVDEVMELLQWVGCDHDLPALRSVGYRQLACYLEGTKRYDVAVDDAKTATRRLAKRQLTWLNKWKKAEIVWHKTSCEHSINRVLSSLQGMCNW